MDESYEKKFKEKGKPTIQIYLIAYLIACLIAIQTTQEVHQTKTPPISTSPSTIVRESSYQHPTNRKRKLFVVGDSHLKRLSKQLFNYSIRDTHAVIKNFDGATTKRLGHHVLPILKEDKPDSVLIHIGTNDVNNHKLYAVSPEKLASDIIKIGRT